MITSHKSACYRQGIIPWLTTSAIGFITASWAISMSVFICLLLSVCNCSVYPVLIGSRQVSGQPNMMSIFLVTTTKNRGTRRHFLCLSVPLSLTWKILRLADCFFGALRLSRVPSETDPFAWEFLHPLRRCSITVSPDLIIRKCYSKKGRFAVRKTSSFLTLYRYRYGLSNTFFGNFHPKRFSNFSLKLYTQNTIINIKRRNRPQSG